MEMVVLGIAFTLQLVGFCFLCFMIYAMTNFPVAQLEALALWWLRRRNPYVDPDFVKRLMASGCDIKVFYEWADRFGHHS